MIELPDTIEVFEGADGPTVATHRERERHQCETYVPERVLDRWVDDCHDNESALCLAHKEIKTLEEALRNLVVGLDGHGLREALEEAREVLR